MNIILMNALQDLRTNIEKLVNTSNLTIDECIEATHRRSEIEIKKHTGGHNPNIKAMIGAAWINLHDVLNLNLNAEFFIKHKIMTRENLEKQLLSKFGLANEAYGVALGGCELKFKDSVDVEERNLEYRLAANAFEKEHSSVEDINKSEIVRNVMNLFGLDEKVFRNLYRIIYPSS